MLLSIRLLRCRSGSRFFSLYKQGERARTFASGDVSVLKRARPSNCWERQGPETRNMGYVGSREVVCTWFYVSRVLTLPLREGCVG